MIPGLWLGLRSPSRQYEDADSAESQDDTKSQAASGTTPIAPVGPDGNLSLVRGIADIPAFEATLERATDRRIAGGSPPARAVARNRDSLCVWQEGHEKSNGEKSDRRETHDLHDIRLRRRFEAHDESGPPTGAGTACLRARYACDPLRSACMVRRPG